MSYAIVLDNVGYKRIENGDTFHVLKGICLQIDSGTNVSLIGINGSGKTTLVKILSGELIAERYDVSRVMVAKVGAFNVAQGKSKKNGQATGVATVHQFVQDDLIDDLSVLKNIHIRQIFAGAAQDNLVTVGNLNNDFTLYNFKDIEPDKLVRNLSGGQKQLLNVLIALKYECGDECKLLMLDEHLNALDVVARKATEDLINNFLNGAGSPTVITVTHDLTSAVTNSSKIIALKKDRTASYLDVDELKNSFKHNTDNIVNELIRIITDE